MKSVIRIPMKWMIKPVGLPSRILTVLSSVKLKMVSVGTGVQLSYFLC